MKNISKALNGYDGAITMAKIKEKAGQTQMDGTEKSSSKFSGFGNLSQCSEVRCETC